MRTREKFNELCWSLLDGNKCGDNLYILAMVLNAWSAKTQRMVCNPVQSVFNGLQVGLQWSAGRSASSTIALMG